MGTFSELGIRMVGCGDVTEKKAGVRDEPGEVGVG